MLLPTTRRACGSSMTNDGLDLTDHELDVIHPQFAPGINQSGKPPRMLQIAV